MHIESHGVLGSIRLLYIHVYYTHTRATATACYTRYITTAGGWLRSLLLARGLTAQLLLGIRLRRRELRLQSPRPLTLIE